MKSIFEREKEAFLPTYQRIPIEISHGEGVYLFDKMGNKYLDFFSGLAVNALGYAHPKIIKAVTEQINKFAHLSNNYITDIQIEFTEKLLKYSEMDKAFLTNSGTEAIEGTLKLIRLKEGPDKIIYALSNSFHGRTYGALSLTGRDKYRKGFEPLLPNIYHLEFNNVDDLERKVNQNTAAVIFEFIQGEGGINEVSEPFIKKIIELKNIYNYTLVADAIQDGIGRTGKAFVHNYFDIKPDIIVTAKAIGGGLPLGAFLTTDEYKDIFTLGKHGTTYGGNPVCCAAGKVVLEEVFENGLLQSVHDLGLYFKNNLVDMQKEFPEDIKEVRGRGFMIGIELNYDGKDIVKKMRDNKILINCTNLNVLRLLPPLITSKDNIDLFLDVFRNILKREK